MRYVHKQKERNEGGQAEWGTTNAIRLYDITWIATASIQPLPYSFVPVIDDTNLV